MNKILFIDTETGGLSPIESSLLTIGLAVWDNNRIIDSKEIYIKHKLFKITPQAISINKIDLLTFLNYAVEPREAIIQLKEFIIYNFKDELPVTLAGHNTNFDINFIRYFLEENNINFSDYFSHRFIDTASILKYLYYSGKINEDISSSDKAFSYFNINIDNRHSALGDAEGTAKLFTQLLKI